MNNCRTMYRVICTQNISFDFLYLTDRRGEGIKCFMNLSKFSLKMDQYWWISVGLYIVWCALRIESFAFLYQTVSRGEGIKYVMNPSKISLKMDEYRWVSVGPCIVWCVLRILSFDFLFLTVRPGEGIEFFMKSSKVSLNESISMNLCGVL
jgi:hypothetical protein